MYRSSKVLKFSKPLQKKRKKLLNKALLISICIIILIINLIFILRLPFFQINAVISNVKYSEEIENKTLSLLKENYFYLIPKSNILFYPKREIVDSLLNTYKSIESIQINKIDFNTINLNIVERSSVSIVCDGFHALGNNDNCYYLDKNSFIYKKIENENELINKIIYYNDFENNQNIIGTKFLKESEFNDLNDFLEALNTLNLDPKGILIGTDGEYEIYAKNTDDSDMIIYFNNKEIMTNTISTFIAFWNNSRILKKGESKLPIFESINLRFGNNIFYVIK